MNQSVLNKAGESISNLGAYSKVILFGEHSAVYGHPALAMGLPGGMIVKKLRPKKKGVHLKVHPWGLDVNERYSDRLGDALELLLQKVPGGPVGMDVILYAGVPPGAGLGSSASLSVAMVRSLARVRDIDLCDDDVRNIAHSMEKIFHGNSSGLDDTVATYGGMCLFEKDGTGFCENSEGHRLSDQCVQLPARIPGLVLGDTGVKRSTAEMVDLVRRQRDDEQQRVDHLFSQVDDCVYLGVDSIENSDWRGLGRCMSRNHDLLCRLELSCPEIQKMLQLASEAGALGGKLTGAGGGGAVVVLAPGAENNVATAWRREGFLAWSVATSEANGRQA